MKRTLMVIALSSIALATVAATKSLPYEVRTALQRALVNEREAVARYVGSPGTELEFAL